VVKFDRNGVPPPVSGDPPPEIYCRFAPVELTALPRPLAGFTGSTFKRKGGMEGKGRERKGGKEERKGPIGWKEKGIREGGAGKTCLNEELHHLLMSNLTTELN